MTAPVDDLVEHDQSECTCGPLLIPIVTGEGRRGAMVVHRRLVGDDAPGIMAWDAAED